VKLNLKLRNYLMNYRLAWQQLCHNTRFFLVFLIYKPGGNL
jgi:hypothetical protein